MMRLGYQHRAQEAISAQHPRGSRSFWSSALLETYDALPGTDLHAVAEGYVAITSTHTNMTSHDARHALKIGF